MEKSRLLKVLVIPFITALFAMPSNVHAAQCTTEQGGPDDGLRELNVDVTRCSGTNGVQYFAQYEDGVKITSCSGCKSGKGTFTTKRYYFTEGNCSSGYYGECVCSGCSSCTPTTWTAYGTGYQYRKYCDCNTCNTEYRCANGYWGLPLGSASGCTACTKACSIFTTTNTAGSNSTKSTCCAASGSTGSDTTGTAILTAKTCLSN